MRITDLIPFLNTELPFYLSDEIFTGKPADFNFSGKTPRLSFFALTKRAPTEYRSALRVARHVWRREYMNGEQPICAEDFYIEVNTELEYYQMLWSGAQVIGHNKRTTLPIFDRPLIYFRN
jgi:hypothetical protein